MLGQIYKYLFSKKIYSLSYPGPIALLAGIHEITIRIINKVS